MLGKYENVSRAKEEAKIILQANLTPRQTMSETGQKGDEARNSLEGRSEEFPLSEKSNNTSSLAPDVSEADVQWTA